MKSTTPIVARPDSGGRVLAANNAVCRSGSQAPNAIGPSNSPAAISPMTGGCPMRCNNAPHRRAAPRITANCTSNNVV